MRRILSVLMENEPGALSRVVQLFSARGYNIESLTVAPTEDLSLSRLTLVTAAAGDGVEQITKQMNKLVEVYKVSDITEEGHIERALVLMRVRADGAAARDEVKRVTDIFRGRVVDVSPRGFIVEVTGTDGKINAFMRAIGEKNILETVQTGLCGIVREG